MRPSTLTLSMMLLMHVLTIFAEKDKNGNVLWAWTYPSIGKEMRDVLMKKCPLQASDQEVNCSELFGQFNRKWYHFTTVRVTGNAKLQMVGCMLFI